MIANDFFLRLITAGLLSTTGIFLPLQPLLAVSPDWPVVEQVSSSSTSESQAEPAAAGPAPNLSAPSASSSDPPSPPATTTAAETPPSYALLMRQWQSARRQTDPSLARQFAAFITSEKQRLAELEAEETKVARYLSRLARQKAALAPDEPSLPKGPLERLRGWRGRDRPDGRPHRREDDPRRAD